MFYFTCNLGLTQLALCILYTSSHYFNTLVHCATHTVSKVLPESQSPRGSTDLRFLSPQQDTSLHCETTDMGLMYRAVCPYTPQLSLVLIAPQSHKESSFTV